MTGQEIEALRQTLRCTQLELAEALGVTQELVMQWETESRFPTKDHVERMQELRTRGHVPRIRGRRATSESPMRVLSDPELWSVMRKLIAHADLRARVIAMAANYDEPE